MKNSTITLGLMLFLLFQGANAGYAIYYSGAPHFGAIKVTFSAPQSDGYATDKAVIFQQIAVDRQELFKYPYTGTPYFWSASELQKKSQNSPASQFLWNYGCPVKDGTIYRPDYYVNEDRTSPGFLNYYYNSKTWNSIAGIFYYAVKSNTQAYNRFEVNMRNTGSTPVIKRTIKIGQWQTLYYNTDSARNELTPLPLTVTHYLKADSTFRYSNYTNYLFKDQIIPLLTQYVICSIHYEIEFGSTYYAPVTTNHGITIEAEKGITTTPNSLGGPIYVESNYDFIFRVYSDRDITVTTSRGRDADGVLIVNNHNGTYGVTIRRITSNFVIYVKYANTTQSGTGENNQTGNTSMASDAVWAAGGMIHVRTANPAGTLAVYTMTGLLYKQLSVNDNYSLPLPKGHYIILLNGKSYKIVL